MLLPKYQVSGCFNPRAWQPRKLHRKRRKSKWLVYIPTGIIGSWNQWRRIVLFIPSDVYSRKSKVSEDTHLSISIDSSRERLRKPVQSDRFQNVIRGNRIVGPFQEFLSNPVHVSFAAVTVNYTSLCMAHHASRAIGLDDKTCPMVLGRVPCSIA
jgi:hypothetical protein